MAELKRADQYFGFWKREKDMAKKTKKKLTKAEKKEKSLASRAELRREIREHPVLFTTYVVLRALVIAVMILQFFNRKYYDVFLCALTLLLFLIPSFVERRLHIDVPNTLEVIILLFIFSAEILGEIQEYYLIFPFWDTMLHTINGFLMAAIGIAMVDILNRSKKFKVRLSPAFVAVVAFCFSMTIGVLWEFFEYGMDCFFHMDMQKDTYIFSVSSVLLNPEGRNAAVTVPVESVVVNGQPWAGYIDIGLHDTMKDLLVNFIGAAVFSVIGMVYIMGRGRGWFAPRFIPRLKEDELPAPKKPGSGLLEPMPLGEEEERRPGGERFDLYTADGRRTGRTAAKGAACGEDEYDLGVHLYLYDSKGRFLLQKRSLDKSFLPGQWEIHMGHAMAGETGQGAVLREAGEELGIKLSPESLVHVARCVWKGDHHLVDVFFCHADLELTDLQLQKEEVLDAKWITKEEMAQFVQAMEYRPMEYRETVLGYLSQAIL